MGHMKRAKEWEGTGSGGEGNRTGHRYSLVREGGR